MQKKILSLFLTKFITFFLLKNKKNKTIITLFCEFFDICYDYVALLGMKYKYECMKTICVFDNEYICSVLYKNNDHNILEKQNIHFIF